MNAITSISYIWQIFHVTIQLSETFFQENDHNVSVKMFLFFCIDNIWIDWSQYQMLRKLKWSYQAFESAEKSNNNTVINRPGCCNDKKDYRGVKFSFEKLDIKVITIKYIGIEIFIVLMRAIRCILGFSFFLAVSHFLSQYKCKFH